MGRLTLNVLLSFAQFEREVTGERIRDKIAASRKKGMWMGGSVPLGYDVTDKKLVINKAEAERVKALFDLYLKHCNVRLVKVEADRMGLRTKARKPNNGRASGNLPFTRGHIAEVLRNPLYAGYAVHKGTRYAGQHEAIIDHLTWDAVQERLKQNAVERKAKTNASSPSLLAGLIYDDQDRRLIPHHANKKGRKYRYYVSAPNLENTIPCIRLPAREIEAAVVASLAIFLTDSSRLIDVLELGSRSAERIQDILDRAKQMTIRLGEEQSSGVHGLIRSIISRVIVAPGMLCIHILPAMLAKELDMEVQREEVPSFKLEVPITCKRRGVESRFVIDGEVGRPASPDPKLITQIVQAHDLFGQITEGKVASVTEYARLHNMDQGDARRLLPLAFLAPDIVEAILDGRQPIDLTVSRLKRVNDLPLLWADQKAFLGFQ